MKAKATDGAKKLLASGNSSFFQGEREFLDLDQVFCFERGYLVIGSKLFLMQALAGVIQKHQITTGTYRKGFTEIKASGAGARQKCGKTTVYPLPLT